MRFGKISYYLIKVCHVDYPAACGARYSHEWRAIDTIELLSELRPHTWKYSFGLAVDQHAMDSSNTIFEICKIENVFQHSVNVTVVPLQYMADGLTN